MNQEILTLKNNARHLGLVLNEIQLAQFDIFRNEHFTMERKNQFKFLKILLEKLSLAIFLIH